jgi:hypothetical protein
MNPSEAREHLEMVEKIIAASSRKLEVGGEFFICWGLAGSALDLLDHLIWNQGLGQRWYFASLPIMLAALGFSIWRGRYYRVYAQKMSFLQREYFNVLWLAIALALVTEVAGFNLFGRFGMAAIWNVVEAIVLFYIGMHGNRRATIGGIVLVVSIALANFVPQWSVLILGAGVLLGYAGFGVADLLARE